MGAARRALAWAEHDTAALDRFVGDGALWAAWLTLALDRQRAVLAVLVDVITIGPGVRGRNRFDPERVEVTWRA